MIYLGSHVSMKAPNYFLGAIEEAISYGANACMIYTGPPSNSIRKDIKLFKIEEAKALMKETHFSMDRVIIHAPYIINLANVIKPETAQFGVQFLQEELKRVAQIGATTLVLHPGSHTTATLEQGVDSIIKGLNEVLDQDDSNVKIALETMAGKGSEVGRTFEQLASITKGIHKKNRIGYCLDTCHIHDAGYDVSDFDSVLDQFDAILGLENLLCIHLNDSKNIRGAQKDRHANIGQGEIGFDALYQVAHHPKCKNVTKILETPYVDGKPIYKEEIELLKNENKVG